MTDSPGTSTPVAPVVPAAPVVRVNRIGRKARPNTSIRTSLPEALRDALSDRDIVADLSATGARVSFVADAHCTVDGMTALRHREFPTSGTGRGASIAGTTIAAIAETGARGDWAGAAERFLEAFRAATGADLEVVRIYTLRFIVR